MKRLERDGPRDVTGGRYFLQDELDIFHDTTDYDIIAGNPTYWQYDPSRGN